jgi:hypothetical protein
LNVAVVDPQAWTPFGEEHTPSGLAAHASLCNQGAKEIKRRFCARIALMAHRIKLAA